MGKACQLQPGLCVRIRQDVAKLLSRNGLQPSLLGTVIRSSSAAANLIVLGSSQLEGRTEFGEAQCHSLGGMHVTHAGERKTKRAHLQPSGQ